MAYSDWEPVIGLEIHAQLNTGSKLFSMDSASFGGADNEHTSPISLGMPGTLPSVNKKAIEYSAKIGLALNCKIRENSVFARKNYFYPDLPKGYQISQFEEPLCEQGYLEFLVDGEVNRINITRAHVEEDAGKSTHHGDHTLINLNRAGVPLLEIVSEPEIESPKQAAEYARMMRRILRYLDVCDGNLEEGSMRCDCNISIRRKGNKELGTKVEIKNINSFRFVEKALDYEIQRQIDMVESGEMIVQETRLYDSTKNSTFSMRKKEEAHDYRYFPDPDLLPLKFSFENVEAIKSQLPELPLSRILRFQKDYEIPASDAELIADEKDMADYFETVAKESGSPKISSNWITGELLRVLKEDKVEVKDSKVAPKNLANLVKLVVDGKISGKIAKQVFSEMWKTGEEAEKIIKEKNLVQISDEGAVEKIVDEVLAANPSQVEEYKGGKQKVIGFFVGQIMKASKGQANPSVVNKILKEKLSQL